MPQKFALGLYSVRHELQDDLEGTLLRVKEMGYEGVEFFGPFTYTAQMVAAALEKSGLVCVGWHTPWDALQGDKLAETIAYNQAIGNRALIIPSLPAQCTQSIDAWMATAARVNELAAVLAGHGMVTGYHNHSTEYKPVDGVVPYFLFFDNTVPTVVLQLDNGNALEGGADMVEIIRKYPGRAKTVHLKAFSHKTGINTMIGEDDVPWAEFLRACREVGGTEWFIAEYESEKSYEPMVGVKMYIDALKKM